MTSIRPLAHKHKNIISIICLIHMYAAVPFSLTPPLYSQLSEYHFRRALSINPRNSVLHCYLGMSLLSDRYVCMTIHVMVSSHTCRYSFIMLKHDHATTAPIRHVSLRGLTMHVSLYGSVYMYVCICMYACTCITQLHQGACCWLLSTLSRVKPLVSEL